MKQLVWNVSITFEVAAATPADLLERVREVLSDFPHPVTSLNAAEAPRLDLGPMA